MSTYETHTLIIAILSGLALFVSGFGFGVIYSNLQIKKLQRLLQPNVSQKTIP